MLKKLNKWDVTLIGNRSGISQELQNALVLVSSQRSSRKSEVLTAADEGDLRRALFEHTGGSYPELITRGDIKVFLPPIGMLLEEDSCVHADWCRWSHSLLFWWPREDVRWERASCTQDSWWGDCFPTRITSVSWRESQCNGSDVFGSDICTCRPYLIFGIEEAVKEAQKGGSGVVIYFRKEGRALGEVTKVGCSSDAFFLMWK